MIGSIQDETLRRRRRLNSLRRGDSGAEHISSSSSRIYPVSIMTVRTMAESLNADDYVTSSSKNFKLRRRKLRRKLSIELLDNSGSLHGSVSVSSTPSTVLLNNAVNYGNATFREYPMVPGDNPTVTRGPPVSLGWKHISEVTYNIHEYEHAKRGDRVRQHIEMKMPPNVRIGILRGSGYDWKQIQASTKAANIARRQRTRTIERLRHDKFDENIEKVTRGFKNMFKKSKKKKLSRMNDDILSDSSDADLSYDSGYSNSRSSIRNKSRKILCQEEIHELDMSLSSSKYDLSFPIEEDLQEGEDQLDSDLESGKIVVSAPASGSKHYRLRTPESDLSLPSELLCEEEKSSDRSKLSNDTANTEVSGYSYQDSHLDQLQYSSPKNTPGGILQPRLGHAALNVERNVSFCDGIFDMQLDAPRSSSADEDDVCCGGIFSSVSSMPVVTVITDGLSKGIYNR